MNIHITNTNMTKYMAILYKQKHTTWIQVIK